MGGFLLTYKDPIMSHTVKKALSNIATLSEKIATNESDLYKQIKKTEETPKSPSLMDKFKQSNLCCLLSQKSFWILWMTRCVLKRNMSRIQS